MQEKEEKRCINKEEGGQMDNILMLSNTMSQK